jgi:chromosome segregation ATPase
MSEVKATSFRVQEDDIQKFKEFADANDLNQAEMFTALVNTFDLARAKGHIVNRAKEIETFQDLANNIIMMYTNSLLINQTSEERIREELHVELSANDITILNLHEDKIKLKDELDNSQNTSKLYEAKVKELNGTIIKLENQGIKFEQELGEKSISVNDYRKQIETLNSIISEYKVYKDQLEPLLEQVNVLNENISSLTHKSIDLENQLKNLIDINDFYKEQLASSNRSLDTKTTDYKELSIELKNTKRESEAAIESVRGKHDKQIAILNEKLENKNTKYDDLKDRFSDLHDKFVALELQNKAEEIKKN